MGIDIGDLAKQIIGLGAPVIGAALGGPLGGAAGQILAKTLGAPSAEPEVIQSTIQTMPAEDVRAAVATAESQWQTELAKLGAVQVSEVNQTMRAEIAAAAARPDGWWGNWRTQLAQTLVLETFVWPAVIVYAIVFSPTASSALFQAGGLIMTWWGARFGVLGVHVWTGSAERRTAITGETGGVIGAVVKAITKR